MIDDGTQFFKGVAVAVLVSAPFWAAVAYLIWRVV